MANPLRSPRDEPERIVLSNIAKYGWHAVNVIEDNGCPPWTLSIGLYEGSSSGLAVRASCPRSTAAVPRRDSGPPLGFSGVTPVNPLSLPRDKEIP
jgi:hypothetical protein